MRSLEARRPATRSRRCVSCSKTPAPAGASPWRRSGDRWASGATIRSCESERPRRCFARSSTFSSTTPFVTAQAASFFSSVGRAAWSAWTSPMKEPVRRWIPRSYSQGVPAQAATGSDSPRALPRSCRGRPAPAQPDRAAYVHAVPAGRERRRSLSAPASTCACWASRSGRYDPSTLTARAATSNTATTEIADSMAIRIFAQRVSGIASVGLNAIAFVMAT